MTLLEFSEAVSLVKSTWNGYKKLINKEFKLSLGIDPQKGCKDKGVGIHRCCAQYFTNEFGMGQYLPSDCSIYCVGTCAYDKQRTIECVPRYKSEYDYICSFNFRDQMDLRDIPIAGSIMNDFPSRNSSSSFIFNVNGKQVLNANIKVITAGSLFNEKRPSGHTSTVAKKNERAKPFAQSRISFGSQLKLCPILPSNYLLIIIERDETIRNSKKPFVNGIGIWYQVEQKPKLMIEFYNQHLRRTKISFYVKQKFCSKVKSITVDYHEKQKKREVIYEGFFKWDDKSTSGKEEREMVEEIVNCSNTNVNVECDVNIGIGFQENEQLKIPENAGTENVYNGDTYVGMHGQTNHARSKRARPFYSFGTNVCPSPDIMDNNDIQRFERVDNVSTETSTVINLSGSDSPRLVQLFMRCECIYKEYIAHMLVRFTSLGIDVGGNLFDSRY